MVTVRSIDNTKTKVVPKYTHGGQWLGSTYARKIVMTVLSDLNIFERLIDYGRNTLATDVDDYAIEWLLQSDFIDSGNKATDAGKNLLNSLYHFKNF